MTAPYYTLLTNIGAAKLANAAATDTPLNITQMGVGDANGTAPTPDPRQTSLIHECRRADLNTLKTDPNNPNQIIAEQVIPDNVGGWYIRELGLYDADGDLIAVGNCPPSYKPLIEEGASREQVIRMILIVTSDDAVTLKIDPSVVLATREYVDDSIEAHAKSRNHPDATTKAKGFVQLSSDTDSDDETKAATPKAVKSVKAAADAAVKTITTGNNTHEPDNGDVKLGSAADADIVESMTDTTEGRAPVVGWMGNGAVSGVSFDDANTPNFNCIFRMNAQGIHGPVANAPSNILQFQYDTNAGQQIGYRAGVENAPMYHRTKVDAVWGNWAQVFDTLHPPTASQTGALPLSAQALSVDLNTLRDTSAAGVYYQPANAGATMANHYPVSEAGTLLVTPSAYGCQQEYTTFGSRRKFIRGLHDSNGTWEDWNELYGPTNPNEIVSTSSNSFRIVYGDYGAFWRQDGAHLYLMLTNKDDQHGNYNALRPFTVDLATGTAWMQSLGLTDYTSFDARYQGKGSYAAPDTSGVSGGVLHWKNTATGVITMMGTTANVANSGRVAFPFAFPKKCYGVIPTRNNATGEGAAMQPYNVNETGWNLRIAGGGTETVMWTAAGE